MKKFGKITAIIATVAMCLSMVLGLVACGETPKANVSGVYTANASLKSTTMQIQLTVVGSTVVNLYDDGTYMVVDECRAYMTEYNSNAGCFISETFGTYTVTVDPDVEEEEIITLAKPTHVIYKDGGGYFDSDDASTFGEKKPMGFDEEKDFNVTVLMSYGKELKLVAEKATKTINLQKSTGFKPGSVIALNMFASL